MKRTLNTLAFVSTLFTATLTQAAEAMDSSENKTPVAPVGAWELTLGQGYNQGFGEVSAGGTKLQDLARGGPSLQLGFGYRIDPRLFVGVYAEGARYFESSAVPDHTEIYATALGVQANWHFLPFSRIDPWVSLGTGFRAYWIDREETRTEALFGFDVARVRFGADYQLGPSTRIGPMIGANLVTFGSRLNPETDETERIDDPRFTTFVFAGFQGRFEIGGKRVTQNQTLTARR
jgi:hypothetical protein